MEQQDRLSFFGRSYSQQLHNFSKNHGKQDDILQDMLPFDKEIKPALLSKFGRHFPE